MRCKSDCCPSAFVRHTVRDSNIQYAILPKNVAESIVWLKVIFIGLNVFVFSNLCYYSTNLGNQILEPLSQNAFLSTLPCSPCILVIQKMACQCLLWPDLRRKEVVSTFLLRLQSHVFSRCPFVIKF